MWFQSCSIQSFSHVWLFVTPWTAACQASLSITNSWSLLVVISIELVMPSNHLILCRPLLLPPSVFGSIRVFSNESVLCIRWPKYWSFSFIISPYNDYSGLISFRIDWFELLEVQRTLKSLLQHHSSKASVLQCSPFFILWSQSCLVQAIISDFKIRSQYFTSSTVCISLCYFYPDVWYWAWVYLKAKVISIDLKMYFKPSSPSLALCAPLWLVWFIGFWLLPHTSKAP